MSQSCEWHNIKWHHAINSLAKLEAVLPALQASHAIEIDIRVKDGVAICSHDADTEGSPALAAWFDRLAERVSPASPSPHPAIVKLDCKTWDAWAAALSAHARQPYRLMFNADLLEGLRRNTWAPAASGVDMVHIGAAVLALTWSALPACAFSIGWTWNVFDTPAEGSPPAEPLTAHHLSQLEHMVTLAHHPAVQLGAARCMQHDSLGAGGVAMLTEATKFVAMVAAREGTDLTGVEAGWSRVVIAPEAHSAAASPLLCEFLHEHLGCKATCWAHSALTPDEVEVFARHWPASCWHVDAPGQ